MQLQSETELLHTELNNLERRLQVAEQQQASELSRTVGFLASAPASNLPSDAPMPPPVPARSLSVP